MSDTLVLVLIIFKTNIQNQTRSKVPAPAKLFHVSDLVLLFLRAP